MAGIKRHAQARPGASSRSTKDERSTDPRISPVGTPPTLRHALLAGTPLARPFLAKALGPPQKVAVEATFLASARPVRT